MLRTPTLHHRYADHDRDERKEQCTIQRFREEEAHRTSCQEEQQHGLTHHTPDLANETSGSSLRKFVRSVPLEE